MTNAGAGALMSASARVYGVRPTVLLDRGRELLVLAVFDRPMRALPELLGMSLCELRSYLAQYRCVFEW
jgi:hypothetical protein